MNLKRQEKTAWQGWWVTVTDLSIAFLNTSSVTCAIYFLINIVIVALNYYSGYLKGDDFTLDGFRYSVISFFELIFNRVLFAKHLTFIIICCTLTAFFVSSYCALRLSRIEDRFTEIDTEAKWLRSTSHRSFYYLIAELEELETKSLQINKLRRSLYWIISIWIFVLSAFGLLLSLLTNNREREYKNSFEKKSRYDRFSDHYPANFTNNYYNYNRGSFFYDYFFYSLLMPGGSGRHSIFGENRKSKDWKQDVTEISEKIRIKRKELEKL